MICIINLCYCCEMTLFLSLLIDQENSLSLHLSFYRANKMNFLLQPIAYKIASNFHTIFIRFYVRMRLIFLKYFLNSKTFSQIKLIIKKKNCSTLNLHIYKYSVREYYIVNISNVQFRVTKSYNLFKQ